MSDWLVCDRCGFMFPAHLEHQCPRCDCQNPWLFERERVEQARQLAFDIEGRILHADNK